MLNWVSSISNDGQDLSVLDLGSGSGNLIIRLRNFKTLTCVDISEQMTNLAKDKLAGNANTELIISDLLEFFDQNKNRKFDRIVSTYAIHHLIESEKQVLFEEMYGSGKISSIGLRCDFKKILRIVLGNCG